MVRPVHQARYLSTFLERHLVFFQVKTWVGMHTHTPRAVSALENKSSKQDWTWSWSWVRISQQRGSPLTPGTARTICEDAHRRSVPRKLQDHLSCPRSTDVSEIRFDMCPTVQVIQRASHIFDGFQVLCMGKLRGFEMQNGPWSWQPSRPCPTPRVPGGADSVIRIVRIL